MKSIIALFLVLVVGSLDSILPEREIYDLAIRNVNIFDTKTKKIDKNKTILINGDEIVDIISSKKNTTAYKTIEGKGRLVTPGFIDTHVHMHQMFATDNEVVVDTLSGKDSELIKHMLGQQFLKYGTTTIIDMGQPELWIPETIQWQKNPNARYPNVYINGSSIISDEKRTPAQHHEEVMDPQDAKAKVRTYAAHGLQYMKLYSRLRAPEMKAVISQAAEHGITLNAHVDNNNVTIPEAMDYGVKNFEHFFTLVPSVLNYDVHWEKMNNKYKNHKIETIDDWTANMVFFFDYIKELPDAKFKLDQLLDRMAKEGITISTTAHVLGATAGKTDLFTSFNHFPIRRKPVLTEYSNEQYTALSKAFDSMMEFMKLAQDKGVKIRIGTDCRYGGASMMSEFKLLSEAGFEVDEILQIATINGYRAMKLEKNYGSVEVGKKADLLIFSEDPFDDPANLSAHKIIIKGGKEANFKVSLAYKFLDVILDSGIAEGLEWFDTNKNDKSFDIRSDEISKVAYDLVGSRLEQEAMQVIQLNLKHFPGSVNYLNETALNTAGYQLLTMEEFDHAIDFFTLNVKAHPTSWNVYDSLGEAYMKQGNKALSIKNYEQSVMLNPENQYGIEALKKLKK